MHLLGREPQQLDCATPDELARDDHGVGASRGPLVHAGAKEPLGAREELGMVEVLQVVHRDRGRDVERRERDRERVVDSVERSEAPPQPPGPHGSECHRERALRDAAREPVFGYRRLRQSVARTGRSWRCEGGVVERSGVGEPPAQAARRRLRSADLAGHERQQADPHAHRRSVSRVRGARYNPPMPDQSAENGELAGISSNGDVDVAALFEQLKQEVRRSGAAPGEAGGGDDRHAARAEAERLWPVSADRSLRLRPGVRGGLGTPAKAVLRKLMRWYVEPVAYDQRSFNAAALRLIDDLEERVAQLEAELKRRA